MNKKLGIKRPLFIAALLLLSLLFASAVNATTWTKKGITSNNLRSVSFADKNTGYIGADYGNLFKTTDGGSNWSPLTSGTAEALTGMHFLTPSIGYVLGQNGTVFKTTTGGASFEVAANSATLDLSSYNDIFFTSTTSGCVIGYPRFFYLFYGPNVARTTDEGQTWIRSTVGQVNWKGIHFVDPDRGWMIGTGLWDSYNWVNKTVNGGAAWTAVTTIDAEGSLLNSIFFIDPNYGWVVGNGGKIFKTTDGGQTWTNKTPTGAWANLIKVKFVNRDVGWAVGQAGRIVSTLDGGDHWTETVMGADDLNDMDARSGSAYLWIASNYGFVYINNQPWINSVTPSSGVQGATKTITIMGGGFEPGITVEVNGGGVTVNSNTYVSSQEMNASITIEAAAATGQRNVTIHNTDTTSYTAPNAFNISGNVTPPAITSVSPSYGKQGTTVSATITGSNFQNNATLVFSGTGVTGAVTAWTPTQLTVVVTISATAATTVRDLTVTNPDTGAATAAFTVLSSNPAYNPTIALVTPNSGHPNDSLHEAITLDGLTGFPLTWDVSVSFSNSGITVSNSGRTTEEAKVAANIVIGPNSQIGTSDVIVIFKDTSQTPPVPFASAVGVGMFEILPTVANPNIMTDLLFQYQPWDPVRFPTNILQIRAYKAASAAVKVVSPTTGPMISVLAQLKAGYNKVILSLPPGVEVPWGIYPTVIIVDNKIIGRTKLAVARSASY